MPILILGSAGNLGGQLLKVFAKNDVIGWDRDDVDLLDSSELKRRLDALAPEVIINAAAYNAVDRCESEEIEKDLAFLLNSSLPACLADYCLAAGALLIHYSTDYVFGGDSRFSPAYQETDRPDPLNTYGASKAAGEQEVARRALLGLNYYLIRTSKLFGPKGNNPLAKPSFFDIMLEAAGKNTELKAVDAEMSCFTYTPDLAEATHALWEEKAPRGIYHLTNSGAATWYQGAQELFRLSGSSVLVSPVGPDEWPRPAKRPAFSVLANTRRKPLRSWQEALAEYLENRNKL
ncbi:MAG: dTDP-4-dehydrorhamnose reductase [Bacillota bacterium]